MIGMIGHAERIIFCGGTYTRKHVVPELCACINVRAPRTGTNAFVVYLCRQPLHFFLWGHVKNMVYVTAVATRAQLMDRLNAAFEDAKQNPAMLGRVGRSLLRRYQTCTETQGRLFEHVL